MTLLGAVDLGDRLLFASDGVVMHSNNEGQINAREPAEKVWRHPTMNVVWGFSGAVNTGLAFNDWFRTLSAGTWEVLIPEAIEHLAPLNGEARRLARVSEAPESPVSVLAAGYLDDGPRIVAFDTDGGHIEVPPGAPGFDGGGAPHALVGWFVLQQALPPQVFDTEKAFRLAFITAVGVVPMCGPPITFLDLMP
jgi:hypothetical protein